MANCAISSRSLPTSRSFEVFAANRFEVFANRFEVFADKGGRANKHAGFVSQSPNPKSHTPSSLLVSAPHA